MRKNWLALILAGCMVLTSAAGISAEELTAGENISYGMEETLLLPEESEEQSFAEPELEPTESTAVEELLEETVTEAVGEAASVVWEEGIVSEDTAAQAEDLLTSEAAEITPQADETVVYPETDGIAAKTGGVRTDGSSAPEEGCQYVDVTGTFIRSEVSAALTRINQIRKEACQKGYPNPNNPSVKLTMADYHPISWSYELESIAQTRAAEASYTRYHTRTNGNFCFAIETHDVYFASENLAWNFKGMLKGVEQWYEEKEDWVGQNTGSVTGHYESLINPWYTHIGLGCYLPDYQEYDWTSVYTVSGAFGTEGTTTSVTPASGRMTQRLQVPEEDITITSLSIPSLLEKGKTAQLKAQITADFYVGTVPCTLPAETITWKCSNKSIATIDSSGRITGTGDGIAAVYAYIGNLKKVTKIYVSSRPKLFGAYNSSKGLALKFYECSQADSYVIYRKYKGVWSKIATVKANDSSLLISGNTIMYYDTSVKTKYGEGYIYSVAAKRGKIETSYDTKGAAIYRLLEPTISKASAIGNGKVQISWGKVPAHGYEVQYRVNGTTEWKKYKQTTATSQTLTGLTKGQTYVFRVRCYKTNAARGTYYSSYSKTYWTVTVK